MRKIRNVLSVGCGVILLFLVAACGGSTAEPAISPLAQHSPLSTPETVVADMPSDTLLEGDSLEIAPELSVRRIHEDALVITHAFPWPANSLLVETAEGTLVLVDTPYTPEATQQLLDWIAEFFGEREIVAINTGYHVDNLGGNQALIDAGITVHGSAFTAKLLDEWGENSREWMLELLKEPEMAAYRSAHEEIAYVAPTDTFFVDKGLVLTFGDETVQVFYPGPSHSPDNVAVFFQKQKILFGGCTVLSGESVGNGADADFSTWPDAIARLKQFDSRIVVPGHGDRLDVGLLEHTLVVLSR